MLYLRHNRRVDDDVHDREPPVASVIVPAAAVAGFIESAAAIGPALAAGSPFRRPPSQAENETSGS